MIFSIAAGCFESSLALAIPILEEGDDLDLAIEDLKSAVGDIVGSCLDLSTGVLNIDCFEKQAHIIFHTMINCYGNPTNNPGKRNIQNKRLLSEYFDKQCTDKRLLVDHLKDELARFEIENTTFKREGKTKTKIAKSLNPSSISQLLKVLKRLKSDKINV